VKLSLIAFLILTACSGQTEPEPSPPLAQDAAAPASVCHATGDALTNWPDLDTPYNGHVFVFECTSGQPAGECRYLTTYPDGRVAYGCQREGDETPKE
jgi:hypothetical protein